MKFEDAVRKAIRQYYANKGYEQTNKAMPDKAFKYNKKYFDDIENPTDESEIAEGEIEDEAAIED